MLKSLIIGLLGLVVAILALAIGFGVLFLITKLIVWVAAGLFAYDLSDKFWYVFGALILFNALFGGKICSISVRK